MCLLGETYVYIYLEYRTKSGIVGTVDLHYSQYLSYKVTANTELANTETAPRGNTGLDSCEPLVKTFSSPDQYITLSYVCF